MISFVLILTNLCLPMIFALKPEIVLYSSKGADAESISELILSISGAVPDLTCYPDEIKARRICVTSGVWLIYGDINYHAEETDVMISLTGPCKDLPPWLDQKINSIRIVGDPTDTEKSSINLYLETNYRKDDNQLSNSSPEIPYVFNSVIRTGPERWEFFQKEDYSGFSECLNEDEYFVPDFTDRFGVEPGNIKSVRIGCNK